MALSPRDIELRKKKAKDNFNQVVLGKLEMYLDDMILAGHRDILLDNKLDTSIPLPFRKLLNENPDIAATLVKVYRTAGWNVELREDNIYINFKEQ